MRTTLAVVLALILALVPSVLSRVPYRLVDSDAARLRLSWRVRPVDTDSCVPPTAEELARLPVHMRNPNACRPEAVREHIRVFVDGELRADEQVEPSGLRGDRPVYVFLEAGMAPGARTVRVEVERRVPAADDSERNPGAGEQPPLVLETRVNADPRQVFLVTMDDEAGALVLRTGL